MRLHRCESAFTSLRLPPNLTNLSTYVLSTLLLLVRSSLVDSPPLTGEVQTREEVHRPGDKKNPLEEE